MDVEKKIPVIAIDALYNPKSRRETDMYNQGIAELWEAIGELGETPVENIKMVQDDLERLEEHVGQLTSELQRSRVEHGRQLEELAAEQRRAAESYEEEKLHLQVGTPARTVTIVTEP
jgi:t-SNARE complex subunit (syntaxin)